MQELRNHPNQKMIKKWDQSVSNEYRRLMKGIRKKQEGKNRVQGFDTFYFIHKIKCLSEKK